LFSSSDYHILNKKLQPPCIVHWIHEFRQFWLYHSEYVWSTKWMMLPPRWLETVTVAACPWILTSASIPNLRAWSQFSIHSSRSVTFWVQEARGGSSWSSSLFIPIENEVKCLFLNHKLTNPLTMVNSSLTIPKSFTVPGIQDLKFSSHLLWLHIYW
jgi:hypothetical protein